jgi:hypothetical protein
VVEELRRSGAHWACTYPKDKRPRQVQDGAVLFTALIVKDPDDILIFGRAVGMHYRDGVDDASKADIALRGWKVSWPHYVRVHHGQFLAGTMANGVSLNALMTAMKANAFASTKRNADLKTGNTDPRKSYLRKPAVELTPEAAEWIDERLATAFARFGTLSPTEMQGLDWPTLPAQAAPGATP